MTETTIRLHLPFLSPSQAQKHLTVNESLRLLDALVGLSVKSATTSAQPGAPADGDLYVLPAGKTGAAWSSMGDSSLAYYVDGAWSEIVPREGWIVWIADTDLMKIYSGAAWLSPTASNLGLGSMAAQSASAYAALSGATFTGLVTLMGAGLRLDMKDTSGPPDSKLTWRMNTGGVFQIEYVNDAISASKTAISISRAGYVPSSVNVGASVLPLVDNAYDLGSASKRFGVVYAATGTINTSDARDKTSIEPLPESVKRAIRRVLDNVGVFRWKEAIARKGEGARRHIGVTAQAVHDAFLAEGEDPHNWALFVSAPLTETIEIADPEAGAAEAEGAYGPRRREKRPVLDRDGAQVNRLGLRYDQLMLLAVATLAEDLAGA